MKANPDTHRPVNPIDAPIGARVATYIRTWRRVRGMSLGDLSGRLAGSARPMSVATLSKLELGDRQVTVDDLVAIADALGLSATTLLGAAMELAKRQDTGFVGPRLVLSDAEIQRMMAV